MDTRYFINLNRTISRLIDSILPDKFKVSGGAEFVEHVIPKYLGRGYLIYDVGGGKRPYLSVDEKNNIEARVVGIDISKEELISAPIGSYDETIESAIEKIKGNSDGDLVICNAVLEHVVDVQAAINSIYSLLKTGGVALIFVPSRNAAFARINMILPEKIKKKLLFTLYPKKSYSGGFPAYYNSCTPKRFTIMTENAGFKMQEAQYYYWSSYFSFFAPLYLLWRIGFFIFYIFAKEEACECFMLALKK